MGGSGAGSARVGPDPHAVLLRSSGRGRDLHGSLPAAPIRLAFVARGRGAAAWSTLVDARDRGPGRRARDADGFPHGIFRRRRRLRDRACPTPRAAIPDEARLGHIPAGHGYHGCLRLGFAHTLRNSDDHRRGRGNGRAVRRRLDGGRVRGSAPDCARVESCPRLSLCCPPHHRGRINAGGHARFTQLALVSLFSPVVS